MAAYRQSTERIKSWNKCPNDFTRDLSKQCLGIAFFMSLTSKFGFSIGRALGVEGNYFLMYSGTSYLEPSGPSVTLEDDLPRDFGPSCSALY